MPLDTRFGPTWFKDVPLDLCLGCRMVIRDNQRAPRVIPQANNKFENKNPFTQSALTLFLLEPFSKMSYCSCRGFYFFLWYLHRKGFPGTNFFMGILYRWWTVGPSNNGPNQTYPAGWAGLVQWRALGLGWAVHLGNLSHGGSLYSAHYIDLILGGSFFYRLYTANSRAVDSLG